MIRFIAVAFTLVLAACTTPQVQSSCKQTERIIEAAEPFMFLAPPTIQTIVTGLRAGSYVCGTDEYAQAREAVIRFLAQRGIRLKLGD